MHSKRGRRARLVQHVPPRQNTQSARGGRFRVAAEERGRPSGEAGAVVIETQRRSCPDEMNAYEGWEKARPFRGSGIGGDTCCYSDRGNLSSFETSGKNGIDTTT